MKRATIAMIGVVAVLLIARLPVLAQSDYSNPEMGGAQMTPVPQLGGDDQPQADPQGADPGGQSDDNSQAADQDQNQDGDSDSDQGDSDSGDNQSPETTSNPAPDMNSVAP
jgi:hypothetical protein